jgi:hypothetical protein
MSVAFWSATVKNGEPCEVQPPEGFVLNLQQAALVGAKSNQSSQVLKVKTIAIEGEDIDAVIGTLRPVTADQISFSLVFGYDVPVTFSTTGDANGTIHLSGYYQPGPDDDAEGGSFDGDEDMDGMSGDEDDEDSDEDEDDVHNAKLALELAKKSAKPNSKGKVVQLPSDDEEEESDDESDDEDKAVDEAFVQKMIKKTSAAPVRPATPAAKKGPAPPADSEESDEESDEDEEGSEDGSDDEDDEDDSEESDEEAPPMKSQKVASKGTVTPAGQNKAQQGNKPAQPAFGSGNSKPNTPAAKGHDNKPKTPQQPQSGNKPQQHNNNNNRTPQSGNKHNNNNQHGGNKHNNQQSGDKRKR